MIRSWYERFGTFLLENGFRREKVDTTLFRRSPQQHFTIVQIYVDDINFGVTNETICKKT